MCEPHVESDMIAALRHRDEMVKSHLRLRDALAANVAPAAVAVVDGERVDLLNDALPLPDVATVFFLGVLRRVGFSPSFGEGTRAFWIQGSPFLRLGVDTFGIRTIGSRVRVFDALAAVASQAIGFAHIAIEGIRSFGRSTARTSLLGRLCSRPTAVVPMHVAQRLAFNPIALPVCPVGARRILSAAASALHVDMIHEREWFK